MRAWVAAAAALVLGAALPSPAGLAGRGAGLDAPLDPALRVPFGAVFLRGAPADFAPGDRVLAVALPGDGRTVTPRSRAELGEQLAAAAPGEVVLRVARAGDLVERSARPPLAPGWRRLAREAPGLAVGLAFLLCALAVAFGSTHPVAGPLAALWLCIGAAALAQLDLLLPADPGLLGLGALRARLGLVALPLAPACVLHLAMRFPVVTPRLRTRAAAVIPYAAWLPAAASAQLRIHDAAFLVALERIALGASFAAAAILVAASVTAARRMTAIERARTAALAAGFGVAGAAPLWALASGRALPEAARAPAALALLALPAAVAWPILRYRLLALPGPLARPRAVERFLDAATRSLSGAAPPGEVLARCAALLAGHAGAGRVEFVALGAGALAPGPLGASGLALWREHGAPAGVVRAGARAEDPACDRAEAVLPLAPRGGPRGLMVIAPRADGLPYTAEQERMLESLLPVATTALDAAATAVDLEGRVVEKTACLQRALRDRERVLEAARGICEAAAPGEVLEQVAAFAGAEAGRTAWCDAPPPLGPGATSVPLVVPGRAVRYLSLAGVAPARLAELGPQLDVLAAFAGLALARLELLAELKREVERQAAELAEIRSRRLHAEFVRGVAHELRKPVEEIRRGAAELGRGGGPAGRGEALARVRAATRELSRRLDLLLFHSGLRLDRQRVDLARLVDEAVASARAAAPDRDWRVAHARARLPLVGDASRLTSVLENLLDNAVRATSPGRRIRVSTRVGAGEEPGGPCVWLEVADDGVGIPAGALERVFEPGVAFVPGGFGLGLSLCREIVRRHGGRIEVASRPGSTCFRVRLPQFHVPGESDARDGLDPAG
jgi:signal transduction histidine kinase